MTRRRLGYIVVLFALLLGDGFVCASQSQAGLFQSFSTASVQPAESQSIVAEQAGSVARKQTPAQHARSQRANVQRDGWQTLAAFRQRLLPFALYQRPPPSSATV